jgi:plastocyanin
MDDLDSRRLTIADCYGHRFVRPGVVAYDVYAADDHDGALARRFAVDVRDARAGTTAQHDLVVARSGGRLVVAPATITVKVGDFVVWHAAEPVPPFVVDGDAAFFGNDPLHADCRYSHAFARAGVYEWADANGSGLHGVVRVTDPRLACDEDRRQWYRRQRTSVLVMVRGTHAEPSEVAIETGQRVYFAVLSSPGVTVTDVRVLACEATAAAQRRATSA